MVEWWIALQVMNDDLSPSFQFELPVTSWVGQRSWEPLITADLTLMAPSGRRLKAKGGRLDKGGRLKVEGGIWHRRCGYGSWKMGYKHRGCGYGPGEICFALHGARMLDDLSPSY